MAQIQIDKSHLPHVYDVCQCFSVLEDGALAHSLQEQEIEQFYSSNVQRSQAVQSDVRLARRLQDEEEERDHLKHRLQQLEKQDCEYAKMIQEELHRCDEESQQREEEDKVLAKRLQEEEEMKIRQHRSEAGYHGNSDESPLNEGMEMWEQMMRDAELARRLQEEEDSQPQRRSCGTDVDFCAAQVAQDEELARYMQRQEKKSNRKSHDLVLPERSHDPRDTKKAPSRNVEPLHVLRERLNSEGMHSPVDEEPSMEQHPLHLTCSSTLMQPSHNIAEDLDPTFTGRKKESQLSTSPSSEIFLGPRTPHSVFYDYLPEPAFVRPTRRHEKKSGFHRSKEKRENCKQQ
ncbi:coiled-coil domain-containing protein 50 [Trichomycterus rosablanca]|uniref:coiled-coil domain-containing protein 50 n=1 Tax=Trichomycterus rosablanca TaxID=2290929 RepID=UPI002F359B8F